MIKRILLPHADSNQKQGIFIFSQAFIQINDCYTYGVTVRYNKSTLFHLGGVCGLFEAQYYKCMEAFGGKLGRLYCDLEYRDFRECLVKQKQVRYHSFGNYS